ncbi:MAG: VirB8/TrbF family protein [Proteobacteria bacterium]|nr:VirB8/TrbF family protein [Pseudomonadota bacterium]
MSKESEDQQQYSQFVKESVENGSYFKDATDWYIFRYVNPICERTVLFFLAAICIFITYNLVITIKDSLPVVEETPIIIKAKDASLYFPIIKKLKDSEDLRTVDEAVLKYLITTYVKDREEYDFRKSDIEVVNKKFRRIENTSSDKEYRAFQEFMSTNNAASPINNFGKNAYRRIDIRSFKFNRVQVRNVFDKTKDFISANVPTEAEVRYRAVTTINNKPVAEEYLSRISFRFSGIDAEDILNKTQRELGFLVTDYKIYRVKTNSESAK